MGWDSPLLLRYIYRNHALSCQDEKTSYMYMG